MALGWGIAFSLIVIFNFSVLSYRDASWKHSFQVSRTSRPLHLHKLGISDINLDDSSKNSSSVDGFNQWHLHLVERSDAKAAADLAFLAFYRPRFKFAIKDASFLERMLLFPVAYLLDSFDRWEAWLANYFGLCSRGGRRLRNPSLQKSDDSIFLAATPANSIGNDTLLAVVELSFDEANGLLAPPMRPFFPSSSSSPRKPYLSNLCVHPAHRRQGLGSFMCRAVEAVARRCWREDCVYLHVEQGNAGAERMYRALGYECVEVLTEKQKRRHNMMDILYFRKELSD